MSYSTMCCSNSSRWFSLNHLMNKSSICIFSPPIRVWESLSSPLTVYLGQNFPGIIAVPYRPRDSHPASSEGSPHHRSCCVTQELRWGFNSLEVELPATYRSKRPQVSPERLYALLDAFPALKERTSVAGTPTTREIT